MAAAQPTFTSNADAAYYYGSAQAQLRRLDEARRAFQTGLRIAPGDARFPIELAGVAFKEKRYADAATWLRRGLQLKPDDDYANDFLATTYFLQNNVEAALKYWNRTGKPRIVQVRVPPDLRVKPELLDRAFVFAPGSILSPAAYRITESRIGALGIFSSYRLGLEAHEDGSFDADFAARERDGFGGRWQALLSTFRGVFYQTIYPEYFNMGGSAVNFASLVRWDKQRRRVRGSLSAPLRGNPKYRIAADVDVRNENWVLTGAQTHGGRPSGAFNLRRQSVGATLTSLENDRWEWSLGSELSHRDYRNVLGAATTPGNLLLAGYQVKALGELRYGLWRVPERRFETEAGILAETAAIWASPVCKFAKLQATLASHWLPQATGDDYEMTGAIRGGKTLGDAPFDELFVLGIERDNDLWMRAHPGTRDGQKGSAPMGRDYLLMNWEMDKRLYSNGLVGFKAGPFIDLGKILHPQPGLAPQHYMIDAGAQAKVGVLGVGIAFAYGKDLRSGRNVLYVTTTRETSRE